MHHSVNVLHLAKYLEKNVKAEAALCRCVQTCKKGVCNLVANLI